MANKKTEEGSNSPLTLLGIPLSKLDKAKYVLQCRAVISWIQSGARGTITLPTGLGKSIVGLLAVKKLHIISKSKRNIIVVVPDKNLKKQWEGIIDSLGIENVKVYVINTVALYNNMYKCDLLIIDEVHETPGHHFRKVFTNIKYEWLLCLTATLERLDGLESFIKSKAPVCFERSQKTAIEKGWISSPTVLNVPVFLTRQEEENIKSLSKQVGYYMKKFGDFKLMQSCIGSANARKYAINNYPNEDVDTMTKEIVKWAVQGDRAIRQRKEFLYNCSHKIDATVKLLKMFNVVSITFSQSIKYAEAVNEIMGSESVAYHSQIKSTDRKYKKTKSFKTENGARTYAKKNKLKAPVFKSDKWIVEYYVVKKISGSKLAEDNINAYKSGKKRIMNAARGLDKGFDYDKILLGIDGARTSSMIASQQRLGRICRKYTYQDGTQKRPVYINLYIPNTSDEDWLRKSQHKIDFQYWCEDLDEAISIIKPILDGQLGKI